MSSEHADQSPGAPPAGTPVPSWLELATRRSVVRRGLLYAVVVGAILITINHADAIARGEITGARALKMLLTACVPYMVSTLSSVGAMRAQLVQQSVSARRPLLAPPDRTP